MERLNIKIGLLLLIFVTRALSLWSLSAEADLRTSWDQSLSPDPSVRSLGFSVRKIISDNEGDRVILYGLAESASNFHDNMVHQAYLRYKGPLGKWNLTAGRYPLPFGLLTSYSTDRLLFELPVDKTTGYDSDDGLMISGVIDRLEYAASATLGNGHESFSIHLPDLFTGRVGYMLGEFDDYTIGLSFARGVKHMTDHMSDQVTPFTSGALDLTASFGSSVVRSEISVQQSNHSNSITFFGKYDFAVRSYLELNAGINCHYAESTFSNQFFAGVTLPFPWLTLRAGYQFTTNEDNHEITVQLHKLFSASF